MKPIAIQNKLSSLVCKAMFMSLLIVWPVILVRDEKTRLASLNRAKIKWSQMTELLVFGRFLIYLWDYAEGLIKYGSFKMAHRRVRFEQELMSYEQNMNYISTRPLFGWVDFIV